MTKPPTAATAPTLRRRLGWVAFWAWIAALVLGCGGISLDSLEWTTAVPSPPDLVGEWRPSESMESSLRAEWDVAAAPLRIVLDADGTATVDGFDLLRPDTPEWEAARASLRTGDSLATDHATWQVAVAQGGYQSVALTVGVQTVGLKMWCLSPPYSLSAPRDEMSPDDGGYIFFVRAQDDSRRFVLAPVTDVKRDPPGDSIWELAARFVVGTILLVVLVVVVVVAVLLVAVFVAAAIAVAVATVAAIAAGGALGIAATSAIVGLARRSLASGFRTFVTIAAAVPGAVVGTAAAWAWRRVLSGPSPDGHFVFDTPLLVGLLVGAVAGGLVGRFAAIALERLARWIAARVGRRDGQPVPVARRESGRIGTKPGP